MTESKKVIYFDGYCGLCNGFVDFILKIDKKQLFVFSSLQSDYAKFNLPKEMVRDLRSIVVTINGKTLQKTPAVLAILKELGTPWSYTKIFKYVPLPILNVGYDLVAANRYKIFGKRDSCRLPTQEEKLRFMT